MKFYRVNICEFTREDYSSLSIFRFLVFNHK